MKKQHLLSIHPIKNLGIGLQTTLLAAVLIPLGIALIFSLKNYYSTAYAPDVSFSSITGEKIALKDLQNKPVIVTFWASDCPECLKEIPIFIDLYKQYHDKGLEIIAVAMAYDPPNHVIELKEKQNLPYTIALDLDAELAHAFSDVQATPTTFLINPQGVIDMKVLGAFNINELKTHIEYFIKG